MSIESFIWWFDIGSLIVILLGAITLVLSGYLSNHMKINRSLQASMLGVILVSFITSSLLLDISGMRIVVAILVMTFIIPYSITFLSIWALARNTNIIRIQYTAFVGWLSSLSFVMLLRMISGWGQFDSIFTVILTILLLTVFMGAFGGVIGHIIINKLKQYRPEK